MTRYRILLLSLLLLMGANDPGSAQTEVLAPISEETPPAVCKSGWFVSGIRCTGRYCDNIEISCAKIPGATMGADYRWTRWVSEESSSPAWCGPGPYLIAGLACGGRYCDNVSLFCVPLVNLSTVRCWTTRAASEEGSGSLSFLEGSQAGPVVATQLSCSGGYCDNLSFHVCQIRSP
jgi:hypothetical protein